jgi:hypothetical protein
MICAKSGLLLKYWPSGSGEEVKNVKKFTDREMDKCAEGQTIGDQKS